MSFKSFIIFTICLLIAGFTTPALALPKMERYAVAKIATPVLNTPDFREVFGGVHGRTLKADACGQLPSLEFIALPGTVFNIVALLRRGGQTIYRVTTDEYPYPEPRGYYVDSRFVKLSPVKPPARRPELPPLTTIIERLLSYQGVPYVWGGNIARGVPQMLLFYPPATPFKTREQMHRWLLAGLDCSGLLYAATGGYTPRNTSHLLNYGEPLRIEGLSADEIIARVQPLDLIVWKGHVMIILDQERVIESRPDCQGTVDGVRLLPLRDVLQDIMAKRLAVDEHCATMEQSRKSFVIRRWYSTAAARQARAPGGGALGGLAAAGRH